MSGLAALIFDVDGTVADTEELHRWAFNDAFRRFELGWEWTPETYRGMLAISGGHARILAHIDSLRVPAAEKTRLRRLVSGLHAEKTRIFGELLESGGAALRPGVARLIAEARAAGVDVGFVSSSASTNLVRVLARAFGTRTAPAGALVCTDQVARKKPAPDVYELALATLRRPAGACAAFEDSQNGVLAARAAGLFTVAVPSRWTLGQDLSAAHLVLSSLGEPAQPLDEEERRRIGGAPCLGLAELEALRAPARLRGAGA